jgi:phage shock protein E
MRLIALLAAAAILAGGGYYLLVGRHGDVRGVQARQLVAAGARLVDVRSPAEFSAGHLPGAINIPVQELPGRMSELGPPDGGIVVYCRSGHRSGKAKRLLAASGFSRVNDLGPMSDW